MNKVKIFKPIIRIIEILLEKFENIIYELISKHIFINFLHVKKF